MTECRGPLAQLTQLVQTPQIEDARPTVPASVGEPPSIPGRFNGWIVECNTDRPHQALGRCTPAERFATQAGAGSDGVGRTAAGDDWISRRVASNGVISVAWQQSSVGKHHSGERVDVHVADRLLEVWAATT